MSLERAVAETLQEHTRPPRGAAVAGDKHAPAVGARGHPFGLGADAERLAWLVGGDIEDAWDDGETLWVLATFALHRVDRDTMSVSATIRVPHYRHRIVPLLRGRFLALAQSHRQRTPVVSTRDDTVRTVHLPSPELSLDSEAGSVVFSFHDEHAFTYDTDLRKVATRPLPLGVTPVWSGAEIAFLPASWQTARNVYPKDPRFRLLHVF